MSRPVRVGAPVSDDVRQQLDPDEALRFWRVDLAAALELLTGDDVWATLPRHRGGRRLTVERITVGALHLFVALASLDPRPGALVVHAADIWPTGFAA